MNYVLYHKIPYYIAISFEVLCALYKHSLIVCYELISYPCTNLMSYLCIVFITLLLFLFHCQDSFCSVHIVLLTTSSQWRTQEFCSGGGVQQIQLRTEDKENGDLGVVAP